MKLGKIERDCSNCFRHRVLVSGVVGAHHDTRHDNLQKWRTMLRVHDLSGSVARQLSGRHCASKGVGARVKVVVASFMQPTAEYRNCPNTP